MSSRGGYDRSYRLGHPLPGEGIEEEMDELTETKVRVLKKWTVSFPNVVETVDVEAYSRYKAAKAAGIMLGLYPEFSAYSLAQVATVRKRGLHLRRNPIVRQLLEVTIPNV